MNLVDYYNAYLHDKDIKEYVDKYMKIRGKNDPEEAIRDKIVQEYINNKKGKRNG